MSSDDIINDKQNYSYYDKRIDKDNTVTDITLKCLNFDKLGKININTNSLCHDRLTLEEKPEIIHGQGLIPSPTSTTTFSSLNSVNSNTHQYTFNNIMGQVSVLFFLF